MISVNDCPWRLEMKLPRHTWRILIGLGAGVVLLASVLIPAQSLPHAVVCPFRLLTGYPCPGCGLTHAFCDISHGRLLAAWQSNSFGFFFYLLAIGSLLWPFIDRSLPPLRPFLRRTHAALWAPPVVIAAMWAMDLHRIFSR